MKKFFAVLFTGVFLPVAALAMSPGTYTATVDINIRSMPSMSGTRIGHYNQGDTVTVLQVVGSWCKVPYKSYNAYVYCSLLKPATVDAAATSTTSTSSASTVPVVTNGLVTQSLNAARGWLVVNNEGINYINNSYFEARNEATTSWDGEARIADFYFQWPLLADSKCSLTFSGPFHAHAVFKADCFDKVGMLKTWKEDVDKPLESYNLPLVPFRDFIDNVLADKGLMVDFDTYFANSLEIKGLFRLYKNVNGADLWEAKFIDENSGLFMIVSADAQKVGAAFSVQKGRF